MNIRKAMTAILALGLVLNCSAKYSTSEILDNITNSTNVSRMKAEMSHDDLMELVDNLGTNDFVMNNYYTVVFGLSGLNLFDLIASKCSENDVDHFRNLDSILAARNYRFTYGGVTWISVFPKWIEFNFKLKKYPVSCKVYQKSCRNGSFGPELTIPEKMNLKVESLANTPIYNLTGYKVWKKEIIDLGLKIVRRKFRADGRPIVGQDAAESMQDAIDSLNEALNSPKYFGLKEWMSEWCPDYEWVDVNGCFMDDAEFAKFKEEVYNGDIKLDTYSQILMLKIMGLDEYNKFVEDFNR